MSHKFIIPEDELDNNSFLRALTAELQTRVEKRLDDKENLTAIIILSENINRMARSLRENVDA